MSQPREFGFSEADLGRVPTVFRPDLFKGSTVVVSGAGGGLGRAMAALFARLGANLAICGRNPEKLDRAAGFLRGLGSEVASRQLTIRDPEQVNAFMAEVHDRVGDRKSTRLN